LIRLTGQLEVFVMNRQVSLFSVLTIAAALACSACNKKDEASAAEPSAATGSSATSSGIPECDAYLAAVEKYMSCDKIPQATRDATKQGFESTKQSWAALKGSDVPEATKQAVVSGCKQGLDGMAQAAKAMGCEI
jgi:hypothetical protein